jgi:hypothetical protein
VNAAGGISELSMRTAFITQKRHFDSSISLSLICSGQVDGDKGVGLHNFPALSRQLVDGHIQLFRPTIAAVHFQSIQLWARSFASMVLSTRTIRFRYRRFAASGSPCGSQRH